MKTKRAFAALIFVTDVEESAVLRMFDWKPFRIDGDAQMYFRSYNSRGQEIIAARQGEMGMTASAVLTMKLAMHFQPVYVIMPGIAAGTTEENDNEQMFGDVVLTDMIWNYSNGKYVPRNQASIFFGEVGFVPRPTVVTTDPRLQPFFEKAAQSTANETHVRIGTMASGAAVVANREVLNKQIKSQFSNTLILDMESYGVAYAAAHATEPKPMAIIAKSICDFADDRKNDEYQKFAAYTSSEFVKFMLEDILE